MGAGAERILVRREDPELVEAMVSRLRSAAPFVREVAGKVFDKGDRKVTGVLLAALEDRSLILKRRLTASAVRKCEVRPGF